ncbi:hypothetical protein N7G274_002535 [Stereocaulon virgatum]|uniref:Uncharacterized protein n=1 Tax=Stereocaulon virgatum TaxID=373712 RepID=A0ABR4AHW0_9LECA
MHPDIEGSTRHYENGTQHNQSTNQPIKTDQTKKLAYGHTSNATKSQNGNPAFNKWKLLSTTHNPHTKQTLLTKPLRPPHRLPPAQKPPPTPAPNPPNPQNQSPQHPLFQNPTPPLHTRRH